MNQYSEAEIEGAFAVYAKNRGCLCEKLILKAGKGWPDRTIFCPNGIVFLIEFKKPTGEVSPQQTEWLRKLRQRKIECYVFDNLSDATGKLDEILGRSSETCL
jgi:hypothetical protein